MYRLREYRRRNGEWSWTLIASNGKKVATAGEGFKRRATMRKTTRKLFPWLGHQ